MGWGGSPYPRSLVFSFIPKCVYKSAYLNPSTLSAGTPVCFLTCKIRGVGSPVKRSKVLSHLTRLSADIVFLQETHHRLKYHHRL